jgi:hypothetical protein
MPYKNYDKEIEERLSKYLELYEVSNPNDIESLRAMIRLEIGIERQQKALLRIDPLKNPKQVKDIQSSIRDATNSYTELQRELNIDRRKRVSEDEEDSVPKYIERLKKHGQKFLDTRTEQIVCPKCGQWLGRLWMPVKLNGVEPGSIGEGRNPPRYLKYAVIIECWKCEESGHKNKSDTTSFGKIGNDDILLSNPTNKA